MPSPHPPLITLTVPPHHLAHLVGQGILFVRDAAGMAVASLDLESLAGNVLPKPHSLEVHSSDAPWGRIRRTRLFGRCIGCYDERGRQVAVVVIDEAAQAE